ncbi:hypothetical protein FB45DRAFT_1127922 [Roridomyces roridus]|uniref:SANT domain-containing protein n=1 Tax=Roridomyces roridus TaxID=1738132 RepID=A0AAD7B3Q5_9AGAR|nr:hypothetical protein FB45DRAFT_1127922 [Roridomyces roridus]
MTESMLSSSLDGSLSPLSMRLPSDTSAPDSCNLVDDLHLLRVRCSSDTTRNSDIPGATPDTLARYQRLLQSNEPPGAAELSYIHAVVSNTAACLGDLDGEISRLRNRLAQLEKEQTQLSGYHSQNAAIISPLRRMPPEILAQIFSKVLGLSHWRKTALSTPSLWSTVYVNYGGDETVELDMIQAQAERARHTLKIHFYTCEDGDPAPQRNLFRFLAEHSACWEELSIRITRSISPPFNDLRGRLPSLRRLWVHWDAPPGFNPEEIDCFTTASSLVEIEFDYTGSVAIGIPPSQLTCYRLRCPWEIHQSILEASPSLIEAKIDITEPFPEPARPTLEMQHLERLYVSDAKALEYLRTPRLAEIALEVTADSLDRLDSFILRSSCSPKRLCLTGAPLASPTETFLRKHSSVSSFALRIHRRVSCLLHRLRPFLAAAGPYPHTPPPSHSGLTRTYSGTGMTIVHRVRKRCKKASRFSSYTRGSPRLHDQHVPLVSHGVTGANVPDVCAIMPVHAFLEQWGPINYQFVVATCMPERAIWYWNLQDKKFELSSPCYLDGRVPSTISTATLSNSRALPPVLRRTTGQTKRLLLLLQGAEMHDEDWSRIEEHVGTRRAQQCIRKLKDNRAIHR